MVTMSIMGPPAVLLNRSVTPDSRSRLPNISMPMRGALEGTTRDARIPVTMGKRIAAL